MIPEKDIRGVLAEVLSTPAWGSTKIAIPEGFLGKEIVSDSREIKPGFTFAAFPGEEFDGRNFISDAITRGAASILWDSEKFTWNSAWAIPNLPVPDLQAVIGIITSEFYGNPSKSLWMVGVTGTNGKTSCCTWIAQAFEALGKHAAVIGTLGNGRISNIVSGIHTTPSAVHIQKFLADFSKDNVHTVALEASSHGLLQGRANGIAFDVALFTNLSRDHLDYHGDMVNYGAAKTKLFAMPGIKHAVINIDDKFGEILAEALEEQNFSLTTYGMERGDLAGIGLQLDCNGIRMKTVWREEVAMLESPLLGAFNAYNLLAVIGVLLVSGISLKDAVHQAGQLRSVPGRLQQLGGNEKPIVVIDYAHTPDALEKVLKTLRPIVKDQHRLICVFGCGGDRDRGKRPQMGAVVSELADVIIVTSDNPRSESPIAIIDDIIAGATTQNFNVIEDRKEAIKQAIAIAEAGDVVLIAGKGHETCQEINGVRIPFSDTAIASLALMENVDE